MIEKLSFLLCDVTAKAEMFLDFKKNYCDNLVLFYFSFVFSRAVHHKAKYTNKTVCYLSNRHAASGSFVSVLRSFNHLSTNNNTIDH